MLLWIHTEGTDASFIANSSMAFKWKLLCDWSKVLGFCYWNFVKHILANGWTAFEWKLYSHWLKCVWPMTGIQCTFNSATSFWWFSARLWYLHSWDTAVLCQAAVLQGPFTLNNRVTSIDFNRIGPSIIWNHAYIRMKILNEKMDVAVFYETSS